MSATGTSVNDDVSIERELSVKLTPDELRERGESMSDAELKIERLKDQRKDLNGLIKTQTDLRNRLAHVIDSGSEYRTVVCKWIAFERENRWALVRQDTGEDVESRAMTAADRQRPLDFESVEIVTPAGTLETTIADFTAPMNETTREQLAAAIKKPRTKPAKPAKGETLTPFGLIGGERGESRATRSRASAQLPANQ